MAKCNKCENDSFKLIVQDDEPYCIVQCSECETAIGVLENFDLKKTYNTLKGKVQLAIDNTVALEQVMNRKTYEIKNKIEEEFKEQNEKIDYILFVAEQMNKKLLN